jgi:6,7-dimethyl-8-ribityllumazine synthase
MVEARRGSEDETPLQGARILIVESDYYAEIAAVLRAGAVRTIERAGAAYDLLTVPGALEIPQAIALALDARDGAYDGVVALGCVIRGETSHYDIVAGESARALTDIAIARKVPIGNGILTVDAAAQAKLRAAVDKGDKGGVAAAAALALVRIRRRLARPRERR